MIVERIKKEFEHNPNVIFPYGAIKKSQLLEALEIYTFRFPNELVEFWSSFGGGELFQEETFLYPLPTGKQEIQDIKSENDFYTEKGLDPDYFIFETDSVNLAAFNKKTHEIAVFFYKDLSIREKFTNINQWFESFWSENL